MRALSHCQLTCAGVLILALGLWAAPVSADPAVNVEELQRIIAAQQEQLNEQSQILQKLQSQVQALIAPTTAGAGMSRSADERVPAGASTTPVAVTVAAQAPATAPSRGPVDAQPQQPQPLPEVGGALSANFRHDRRSPTGSNFTLVDPAARIPVPGTRTAIGLHGFAEFQMMHTTNGIDSNEFDTFLIPVNGSPSQTEFSVNPSRFAISSQTNTSMGRLNTMISMDFNGELDNPDPRLRVAYGEYINDDLDFALLGGQTFGTMLDLKSVPETLDFAGPTGYFARRQPLGRFTSLVADREVLTEIAVETPENAVYTDADAQTRLPDFVGAATWLVDGEYISHLRLAGLARDLRARGETGKVNEMFGWAIAGSGKINLPVLDERDSLKFGVQYGEGYGGQIKSGPADAIFNPATSKMSIVPVFSTYGGLQHWWTDAFRSNVVFGYLKADNPSFVEGDTLKSTAYFASNIVWNPFKTFGFGRNSDLDEKVTLGFEYLYGYLKNQDGQSGNSHRFLFSSRVDY